jgi:hypothetical protein
MAWCDPVALERGGGAGRPQPVRPRRVRARRRCSCQRAVGQPRFRSSAASAGRGHDGCCPSWRGQGQATPAGAASERGGGACGAIECDGRCRARRRRRQGGSSSGARRRRLGGGSCGAWRGSGGARLPCRRCQQPAALNSSTMQRR